MTKFKLWDNTIYIDYHIISFSKYFNEFEIFDEKEFRNHRMNVLIDLIGKYDANEIKGKSHRHKGIRKVQEECEKDFKILVSKTEIKSLLRSQTRKSIPGFGKRCLKCPYNMDYI